MKRLITPLLVFVICVTASAQTPYYDAVKLLKMIESDSLPVPVTNCVPGSPDVNCAKYKEWTDIVRPYVPADKQADPMSVAKYLKRENPFFSKLIKKSSTAVSRGGAFTSALRSFDPKQLGNMNVTSFADGLARFLVKRMKEELTITFFDRFEEELKKQKDLQKLFPDTYTILKTVKTQLYSYQTFLPALREAFQSDLSELLANGYAWSTSSETDLPLRNLLQANPELHNVFKIVFYVGRELDHGVHPGDIITSITDETDIDFEAIHPNLRPILKISDLFSQSLRSASPDRYWITPGEARQFANPVFVRIFLGIMYEQSDDADLTIIINGAPRTFKEVLKDAAIHVDDLRATIKELSEKAAHAEDAIQKITKEDNEKKGSDYFRAASSVVDLAITITDSKFYPGPKPDKNKLEEIKFYTDHGASLCANIETRAYNSAVFDAYAILSKAIPGKEEALSQFLKYGTFAATVANAQSSEEVADAIESVALPVGSASIKRKTKSNIALNAYIGLAGGSEYYGTTATWKGIFGMTAPVGVAFSWGHACCTNPDKSAGSSSIFISLIDVGALSTFRIDDDETEALPEVTLANIFAPGLYYVYGIPKTPVSVGLGAQLGPQLRKITATDATLHDDLNVSLRAFVAVDIPLINFRTKPR